MIDGYTTASIIIRLATICILTYVVIRQIRILKPPTELQWLKRLLISLVCVMMFNSILSVYVNFHRQIDGNLIPNARHVSAIFNALTGLCSATILAIVYYRNDE